MRFFERLYMDVKQISLILCISLFIINCDKRSPAQDNSFRKTGTPGCEDATYSGEYLVHWKSGEVTVEKYVDDESFLEDFVEKHKDEIIISEPHYKIAIEQKVELTRSGWGGYPNWGVDAIGAAELWDKVDPEAQIKVAVIDSGVDISHPELVDAIAINEAEVINGVDDDGNGLIDDRTGYDFVRDTHEVLDYTGHGTHVAGTIGAQHNVGSILGVAPNIRIIPIAFLNGSGGGSVSAAINSIRYAADQNAKVINASWGGPTCSSVLQTEIQALQKKNILFITAAGNSGNNLLQLPEYPAAFEIENMITVGASAYSETCKAEKNEMVCVGKELMASFTNFGEPVDLVGPGAAITSTYPDQYDQDGELDGLTTINGTSMATPHVAAAAALLWSIKPSASYGEIKAALLDGVRPGPFRVKSRGSLYLPTALERLEE